MANHDLIRELGQEAEAVRKSAERLSTIAASVPNHSRQLQRASRTLLAASEFIAVLQTHIQARQSHAQRESGR